MYTCLMQDSVLTVTPTSRYGKSFDTVRVETYFQLENQLPESEEFLVPSLKKIPEQDLQIFKAGKVQFAPMPKSVVAQEVQDYVLQVTTGNVEGVRSDALLGLSAMYMDAVKLEEITTGVYHLNYSYSIYPDEVDGYYYIHQLLPFKGFDMPRGTVRLTAVLPAGAVCDRDGTTGKDISGTVVSEEDAQTFANGLTVVSFLYQQDPEFIIKYRY
ncbi:hypothetical protein QUF84_00285 [Fictibacillus enclensis]|uniref:hypothetical protein n=1 Tax=Fictibacillus enclensis TaxID=1017270 RepID=UPI0025A14F6E|nr:hypothetical protein [Fictibacillus enclensis]MDM5335734.1 hypothetical protein [Fictibacillus enclensis]